MAQCENCGKIAQVGMNVSHSKHRSKRRFNPNIQRIRVASGNVTKRQYLCTKCIKAMNKV
jgi:large subunit ribosomal protein L28